MQCWLLRQGTTLTSHVSRHRSFHLATATPLFCCSPRRALVNTPTAYFHKTHHVPQPLEVPSGLTVHVMSGFASTATNNRSGKALVAGAGIAVAVGAVGAVLYSRALRSRGAATTSAAAVAAKSTPASNANVSAPKRTDAGARKEPCEGCDCGLGSAGGGDMGPPGPVEGTMHTYERHVIICSGREEWPKMIEAEEASIAQSLHNMCLGAGLIWTKKAAKAAAEQGKVLPPNRVMVTACTEPSRGRPGYTDVIVFPEGLVYSLDPTDLDTLQMFVKVQLADRQVATELKPIPVWYEKMVLVCTHGSRDKRCGRVGPQAVSEMHKELRSRGVHESEVAVRGCSHIGGHKYAGVLIIYPQGDWYGLVSKHNAAAIVDKAVLGNTVVKANWRGNMSNPGRKAENPKPTSGRSGPKSVANGTTAPGVVKHADNSANGDINGVVGKADDDLESVSAVGSTKSVQVVQRPRRESFDGGCEGA